MSDAVPLQPLLEPAPVFPVCLVGPVTLGSLRLKEKLKERSLDRKLGGWKRRFFLFFKVNCRSIYRSSSSRHRGQFSAWNCWEFVAFSVAAPIEVELAWLPYCFLADDNVCRLWYSLTGSTGTNCHRSPSLRYFFRLILIAMPNLHFLFQQWFADTGTSAVLSASISYLDSKLDSNR